VFNFGNGLLTNEVSVAPNGGYGFGHGRSRDPIRVIEITPVDPSPFGRYMASAARLPNATYR
jgi:hypothetical protein